MDKQLTKMIIDEVKENRRAIVKVNDKLVSMDKDIFANKFRLSLFIGGFTLMFNITFSLIWAKILTYL